MYVAVDMQIFFICSNFLYHLYAGHLVAVSAIFVDTSLVRAHDPAPDPEVFMQIDAQKNSELHKIRKVSADTDAAA